MQGLSRVLVPGVALAAMAACGAEPGPRWIELAADTRPSSSFELEREGLRCRVRAAGDQGRLVLTVAHLLEPEGWQAAEADGEWRRAFPFDPGLVPPGAALRVRHDDEELEARGAQQQGPPPDGRASYRRVRQELRLWPASGGSTPLSATLEADIELGRPGATGWLVSAREFQARAVPLLTGQKLGWDLELGAEGAVRFRAWTRPLVLGAELDARLRVYWAGRLHAELQLAIDGAPVLHRVALPSGASGRLELELVGDAALTMLCSPVVGPLEIGTPADRSWSVDRRRDVVLFLADTFRADNLKLYGAELSYAPNLDALAEQALCFRRARAPSNWTLPSHASMFTGLLPPEHGATRFESALGADHLTLAEHLSAHGFRTGAVTESGFVSRSFGLAQGFEWFEERQQDRRLLGTMASARAFLEADDGRPCFLFVHTYRTHTPYRRGPEEDTREWRELVAAGVLKNADSVRVAELSAEVRDSLRELYRDGVTALDQAFGDWMGELRTLRFLEHGALVFTSDHGEALWEHGEGGHHGPLWEERIRVPLLLVGAGVRPGSQDADVSLVDLPRTIAALAGVPPADIWAGRSLLEPGAREGEGPHLAFETQGKRELGAAILADKKIMTRGAGKSIEVESAYELRADPLEARPLEGHPDWVEVLRRELLSAMDTGPGGETRAGLSDEALRDLEALGYTGDD